MAMPNCFLRVSFKLIVNSDISKLLIFLTWSAGFIALYGTFVGLMVPRKTVFKQPPPAVFNKPSSQTVKRLLFDDESTCRSLLSEGSVVDEHWRPTTCNMFHYNSSDVTQCAIRALKQTQSSWNRIVFIGDSRVREQYLIVASVVSRRPYVVSSQAFHHDHEFRDDGIKLSVKFHWQPVFGQSTINLLRLWLASKPKDRPQLVIAGTVLWHLKNRNPGGSSLKAYEGALRLAVPIINRLQNTTKIVWMVQAPVVLSKLHKVYKYITNDLINAYNAVAQRILAESAAYLWSGSGAIAEHFNEKSADGIHVLRTRATVVRAQIILNLYCNRYVVMATGSPSTGGSICCSCRETLKLHKI